MALDELYLMNGMGTGKKIYAEEKPTEVPMYNIHTHTCSHFTLRFLILKS
jgi:hypothetical protein